MNRRKRPIPEAAGGAGRLDAPFRPSYPRPAMSEEKKGRTGRRTILAPILAAAGVLLLLFLLRTGGMDRREAVRIPIAPVGPVDGPVRELIWRRPAGAARFSVEVFRADGERIWTAAVRDTAVAVPEELDLRGGTVYRWRVTAHFPDGVSQAAPDETFHIRSGGKR